MHLDPLVIPKKGRSIFSDKNQEDLNFSSSRESNSKKKNSHFGLLFLVAPTFISKITLILLHVQQNYLFIQQNLTYPYYYHVSPRYQ